MRHPDCRHSLRKPQERLATSLSTQRHYHPTLSRLPTSPPDHELHLPHAITPTGTALSPGRAGNTSPARHYTARPCARTTPHSVVALISKDTGRYPRLHSQVPAQLHHSIAQRALEQYLRVFPHVAHLFRGTDNRRYARRPRPFGRDLLQFGHTPGRASDWQTTVRSLPSGRRAL